MKSKIKTTIVIPAFNEERTIKRIIGEVSRYGDDVLVVCAKKSSDDTRRIAESTGVKVVVDNGRGKGDAVRVAIREAKGDILVFFDSDGSHIADDIPKVVAPVLDGSVDMVIASRMLGGSEELHGSFSKFFRLFMSMCIAQIINWRFGKNIADTQNGFRAIKRSVAQSLDLRANGFDVETEMVMKCYKKGYGVVEVPSMEFARVCGKSGINLWTMSGVYVWRVFVNLF